jgi:hypothetical protein
MAKMTNKFLTTLLLDMSVSKELNGKMCQMKQKYSLKKCYKCIQISAYQLSKLCKIRGLKYSRVVII